MNQQDYQAVGGPEVFAFTGPSPFGGPMPAPLTTARAAGPRAGADRCRPEGGTVDAADEGVSTPVAGEGAGGPGSVDAGQLARAIRRLAVDAHRALRRPDASDGELLALRRRTEVLLRAARGSRQGEIRRWLRCARRALDEATRPLRRL
jgi:hypothetical protein